MPSSLHIGLVADPDSVHTRRWAAAVRAEGARITVFSLKDARIDGVACVRVDPPLGRRNRITYVAYLTGAAVLRTALREHGVDVVHAIDATPNGVWASRAGCRPLVTTMMGSDVLQFVPGRAADTWRRNRFSDGVQSGVLASLSFALRRRFYAGLVRRALEASDLITGDNMALVSAAVDGFSVPRDRVQLLRWGVEPDLFEVPEDVKTAWRRRLGAAPGQPVVLCPRGVSALYQGDVILRGIRNVLESGASDAVFVVLAAGYGIPADVQVLAADLEARFPNFVFERRMLSKAELCELWTLADVFISAPVYDGYSNAVAEGRYVGAIPVVNDTPSTRELFEDGRNAVVVGSFSPEALAGALRHVLADLPAVKPRFAEHNRPWIEQHSILAANVSTFLRWCEQLSAAG